MRKKRDVFMIGGLPHYLCTDCKKKRPVNDFYKITERWCQTYCKFCCSVRAKGYQKVFKKKVLESKTIPVGSPELETFINMMIKELAL